MVHVWGTFLVCFWSCWSVLWWQCIVAESNVMTKHQQKDHKWNTTLLLLFLMMRCKEDCLLFEFFFILDFVRSALTFFIMPCMSFWVFLIGSRNMTNDANPPACFCKMGNKLHDSRWLDVDWKLKCVQVRFPSPSI